MKIEKKVNENNLTITLEGRLDTIAAPELEKELNDLKHINNIVFDFQKLEYISSSGLRILLSCQKEIEERGKVKIINASADIIKILDITGFTNLIDVLK